MTTNGTGSRLKVKPAAQRGLVAASDVVVGDDMLELLSSAMYIDPMSIFREYVQNAADAIQAGRDAGVLGPDEVGTVAIDIDGKTRTVRIRDNGAGLSAGDFAGRLTALGASTKRGTDARGFRGVGRLAGLAYAQEVIFRSRSQPGEPVRELHWDARALKERMRTRSGASDIRDLIEAIVSVSEVSGEAYPAHFFEVELKGMLRLRGDPLLNPAAIGDYLAQVAPLPFSPDFSFGEAIVARLSPFIDLAPLEIRISGLEGPLYRPHRDHVANGNKSLLVIQDVSFLEIPDVDGAVGAIGWFLHHDYEGALANATLQKGFRFRAGNLQVGGDALVEQEFPEPRFNSWTIGEVHVLDRRVIPNGRRDHFEQNAHYNNLVNHLAPSFRDIAHRCRTSSIKRKVQRDLELALEASSGGLEVLRQNSIGAAGRTRLVREIEGQISKAERLAMAAAADGVAPTLDEKVASARQALAELADTSCSDPLSHLKPKERDQYRHFFELIYECSQSRVVAKALVDRIIDRLQS